MYTYKSETQEDNTITNHTYNIQYESHTTTENNKDNQRQTQKT